MFTGVHVGAKWKLGGKWPPRRPTETAGRRYGEAAHGHVKRATWACIIPQDKEKCYLKRLDVK